MQIILEHLQRALAQHDGVSCKRVFHGRGRSFAGFENITVDLYPPLMLVTLFADEAPNYLADFFQEASVLLQGSAIESIALQTRAKGATQVQIVQGELPEKLYAVEDEMRYLLNIGANQNIGFFPDICPARRWLRDNCADKKVLNLFAYTCSFSVAGLAGNAKKVVNIDMSRSAMNTGKLNHLENFSAQQVHQYAKFLPHEIFRSVSRLAKQGPFDIIVVDPPSFQPGSFVAKSDYAKLIRKLPRLLRRGGTVLACLNAPNLESHFLLDLFAENAPQLRFEQRLENSLDFPDSDTERALKMLIFSDETEDA